MAFIDEVAIRVLAGNGGDGCRSFRREKYIPRGGPNGGNGGRGGSVYVIATHDKGSLLDFKYQPKYEGSRGEHGQGSDMDGRSGEDLYLQVPVGTLIYDEVTRALLADLDQDGKSFLAGKGGKGGRGNKSFVSSTNRAPRMTTPGETGEIRDIRLELRLIADVGLVGLPNAGKSSLLRALSRAEPKVADYAFTTIEPNLGVCYHKGQTLTFADLPGLIEGAAQGAGLGHKFLKHICRTRVLLHLIDLYPDVETIVENIGILRGELRAFQEDLLSKEELLIFTKSDIFLPEDLQYKLDALEALGFKGMAISSQSKLGLNELLDPLVAAKTARQIADQMSVGELPDSQLEISNGAVL